MKKTKLTDENLGNLRKGDLIWLDIDCGNGTYHKTLSVFLGLDSSKKYDDCSVLMLFVLYDNQSIESGVQLYGFAPLNKGNLYLLKEK